MSVRAKFKVASITKDENGAFITLKPVMNGSKENEKFFKWTPSGEIKIGTINAAAAEQFEPGTEFYVDFTPADVAKRPNPAHGQPMPAGHHPVG